MTWVPGSCTLPTVERPLRVAEFDELFATAVSPVERLGRTGIRVRLPAGAALLVRELVARESACCAFFTFAVSSLGDATELVVRVPEAHAAVLEAMARRVEPARTGGGAG